MSETNRFAEMLENRDFAGLFRATMDSRDAAANGEYCACAEPLGDGLTCARCLRRSQSQERAAVHRLVDAHAYMPGPLGFCKVCMNSEDAARHQGQPAAGRTSWGESVQGVVS